MLQQSTALIAVNNSLLFNNQTLFQNLYTFGIRVKNRNPINTKETFLMELQTFKPSFAFLSSTLAGALSTNEVLQKAKEVSPNTKVVLFVSEEDNNKILDYINADADSVIWKENILSSLEFAIRQLTKGQPFVCGKCLMDLKGSLNKDKSYSENNIESLSLLTERELEVLFALTKGTNYKEISKQLFISESTVKTHVNNIFTKLNVNDRTQAVLYALNHGINSLVKNPQILKKYVNSKSMI